MPMLFVQDIGDLISDIGSKMFPNLESVIVQLLATAIMFLIVLKFFFKPIKANIEKRKDHIKRSIEEAEKSKEDALALYEKRQDQLKDAHVEARRIKEEAEIQAQHESQIIIEQGNQQILINKDKAKQELAQELEAARKEIHEEIVNISIQVAGKIVEREVNEEDNKKLISEFIKELYDER